MSVVVMLKDHPRWGRKGQRNPAVPFADANDLVRQGYAERPGAAAIAAAPPTVPAEALEAAGKRILDLERSVNVLQDELGRGADAASKAAERIAQLERENKKLVEDLAAVRAATAKGK